MTLAAATFSLRETAWRWPAAALGLGVAPVLAVNGGFFSTSWGWSAAVLGWSAALAACLRTLERPSRAELLFAGGLAAYAAWVLLSMAWGLEPGLVPGELERTLVYVAAGLTTMAVVRREDVPALLGGVAAGATLVCTYSLLTRLYPGTFGSSTAIAGNRLSDPVGYWNSLGVTAAMALLLSLAFVGSGRHAIARALASAAVPLCAATLYFTFGRGAWLAFGVGLLVLGLAATDRLRLAARAAPPLVAGAVLVWRASSQVGLTHTDAPVALAIRQGHTIAVTALICAGAAAAAAYLTHPVPPGLGLSASRRRLGGTVVVALALVGVLAALFAYGGPVPVARHGYDSFVNSSVNNADLNKRLFSIGNNGRLAHWHVALDAFRAHPAWGIGAGGYADYWAQHRTLRITVQDAHSLYVETLGELGIVGLLLLAVPLAVPLAVVRRARAEPVVAGAVAAFAAYLVHAAADWDWELAGVTLVALLCAGGVVAAARGDAPAGRWTLLPIGLGATVAALAMVGLVGNLAIAATNKAVAAGDVARAARDARHAHRWAPWSPDALQLLGEAQLNLGQDATGAATIRRAIDLRPNSETLWLDLARATRGDTRAAALKRAHELNPLEEEETTNG